MHNKKQAFLWTTGEEIANAKHIYCGAGRGGHYEHKPVIYYINYYPKSLLLFSGEEYLPFHELPELRNIVLTGEEDDDSQYLALTQGEGSIPYNPRPVGNDAVVKFSGRGGFRPTYD